MKSVYDMNVTEFKAALAEKTTPEEVFEQAGKEIYGFLSDLFEEECGDSLLREWAFGWASRELDRPYEDIYMRWMNS